VRDTAKTQGWRKALPCKGREDRRGEPRPCGKEPNPRGGGPGSDQEGNRGGEKTGKEGAIKKD